MSSSPTPPPDGLDPREDERIRQVAGIFIRQHSPIPGYDEDDLYQEGRVAWLRARKRYRADRGASISTYLGRVVENRLRDLARHARAASKWSPRGSLSLNVPVSENGDPLGDLLQDDAPGPDVDAERSDLLEQLARVRGRLPHRQRDVLDALAEDRTRAGIARDLGISRDTLYEDIRRIQQVCRDEGLEDFLR